MPGKARKSLRTKTIQNVKRSTLSETDKKCIIEVFERYEKMTSIIEELKEELNCERRSMENYFKMEY